MTREMIDELLNDNKEESDKVGMGIGMKYVRRILQANYGEKSKLQIRSEPGKGTVVTLRLPVAAPKAPSATGGELQ